MSLFSHKPVNRRRRSRKEPETSPWDAAPGKKPTKRAKTGKYVEQVYELNAQIGAIENFLAGKQAARALAERMKRDGVIPPPDRATAPRAANRKPTLSLSERRRIHAERNRNGIRFLLLFCLACGLVWWLIFSGM